MWTLLEPIVRGLVWTGSPFAHLLKKRLWDGEDWADNEAEEWRDIGISISFGLIIWVLVFFLAFQAWKHISISLQ